MLVSSRVIKGRDCRLRIQSILLYHVSTDHVSSSVETMGTVDSNQTILSMRSELLHGGVELLDGRLGGNNASWKEDLPVLDIQFLTIFWFIISTGVCEVNDAFEVRNRVFELGKVPIAVKIKGNFEGNEFCAWNFCTNIGIIFPSIRNKFELLLRHIANYVRRKAT